MTTAADLEIQGISDLEPLDTEGSLVFRGRQEEPDRAVMVKVLNPIQDPLIPRRSPLRRKPLTRFGEDPGVVEVYTAGTAADGSQYLVMPYYRIGSLADQLVHGRMPWHRATELITRVAETVARSHVMGLVLADIKPSSILLADPSSPMLSVYGMARRRFDDGSPRYAAPEVKPGAELTPAADVYSLCLSLAALLAGRPPRRGETGAQLLTDIDPQTPAELNEIIERGLSFDHTERYDDARELAVALASHLNREPTTANGHSRSTELSGMDLEEFLGEETIDPRAAGQEQSLFAKPEADDPLDLEALLELPTTPTPGSGNDANRSSFDLDDVLGAGSTTSQGPASALGEDHGVPEHSAEGADASLGAEAIGVGDAPPPDDGMVARPAQSEGAEVIDLDQFPAPPAVDDADVIDLDQIPAPPAVDDTEVIDLTDGWHPPPPPNADVGGRPVGPEGSSNGHADHTRDAMPGTSPEIGSVAATTASHPAAASAAPATVAGAEQHDADDGLPARDEGPIGYHPGGERPAEDEPARDPEQTVGPRPTMPDVTGTAPADELHEQTAGDPPRAGGVPPLPPGDQLADPPVIDWPEPSTSLFPGDLADSGSLYTEPGPASHSDQQPHPAPASHSDQQPHPAPANPGEVRFGDAAYGRQPEATEPPAHQAPMVRPVQPPEPLPPSDATMPYRPFERHQVYVANDGFFDRVRDGVQNAWFHRRISLTSIVAFLAFAVVAGFAVMLLIRDFRSTPATSPTTLPVTTVVEGPDTVVVQPTSVPPQLPEPASTHVTRAGRGTALRVTTTAAVTLPPSTAGPTSTATTAAPTTSGSTTTIRPSSTTSTAASSSTNTTAAPTTRPPSSTTVEPPTTAAPTTKVDDDDPPALQGPTKPLIRKAAVSRIRATSARVSFTSPECVTAVFSYAAAGGSSTQVSGGARCATDHTLLLGTVTPDLEPGTDYTVTITASDGDDAARKTLSFSTLG